VIAVAAGVQDLQRDVAAFGVHGARDRPVPCRCRPRREPTRERCGPAFDVRRKAARDDQPDTAASALGEIRLEPRELLRVVFEPGVHRAHQDAIAQRDEPEVERSQQVRVRV